MIRASRRHAHACHRLLAVVVGVLSLAAALTPASAADHVAPVPDAWAPSREPGAPKDLGKRQRRGRPRRHRGSRRRPRLVPIRSAGRWTSPRSSQALALDLATMLISRTRGGKWGALVVSLTRGDTLFSESPDALMQPASTMKLMTTALALDRFGPDHRFTTDVLRDGGVSNGVLRGNLYLRGGGDPGLSTRFLRDSESPPMDSLAFLAYAAGIRRVSGDIVADASAFDAQKIPDGWQRRYLHASYAAPVSALSLNENLVWVAVQPNGKIADVVLEPPSTAIPLSNHVRVISGASGGRIAVRRSGDGSMDVRGWIGSRSGMLKYSYVIDDPAIFAAGALRAALAAAGIEVAGTIRLGITPPAAIVIAEFPSASLAQLVSAMNRESINHFAELIFRDVARAALPGQAGSAETGLETLRTFLGQKVGGNPNQIRVSDGSGLSINDELTPRLMVKLLAYANDAPWRSTFHASLPVAGESELLRHRMKYTPAEGNLHAKTGTTNTVAALAGYVTGKDGEIIAFSFIYNGADRWNAKATMDEMGATLAEFERQ